MGVCGGVCVVCVDVCVVSVDMCAVVVGVNVGVRYASRWAQTSEVASSLVITSQRPSDATMRNNGANPGSGGESNRRVE